MNPLLNKLMLTCVNCGKTEQEIPLIRMNYRGNQENICPQCLPVLIHKPASLAAKLPGLENLPPLSADH